MWPDRDVQRGRRCGTEARDDALGQSLRQPCDRRRRAPGLGEGARGGADEPERPSRPVAELGEEKRWPRGYRARHERPRYLGEPGIEPGLAPQRGRRHLDAADAVHHAVVDLGNDREAVALQPLDEPRLPEGLPPVELLRHQAAGQALQLPLVPRQRQARVPQMVEGIEGRVIDPHRMAEKRDRFDSLPVARNTVERDGDEVADLVDVDGAPGAGGLPGLEHAHRADVHVAAPVLDAEKRRVESGQSLVAGIHCHRAARDFCEHPSCQRCISTSRAEVCTSGARPRTRSGAWERRPWVVTPARPARHRRVARR